MSSHRQNRRLLVYCTHVLTAGMLFVSDAKAQEISKSELAALPRWCHATQTFNPIPGETSTYESHVARYGDGWSHVHHYCWALVAIMRYGRFDNSLTDRRGFASSALGDMQYVLDKVQPDFVLWTEIVAKKTRLLIRERQMDQAMASAKEMLSAYPNRADSYGLQAEVLYELGRRDEARKVLKQAETKVSDPERLKTIRSVLKL